MDILNQKKAKYFIPIEVKETIVKGQGKLHYKCILWQ